MTNASIGYDMWFCLIMGAATIVFGWELFNLQFDALRHSSRLMRIMASASLFALVCSFCGISGIDHRLGPDWPQLVLTISLACLLHWFRSSGSFFTNSSSYKF